VRTRWGEKVVLVNFGKVGLIHEDVAYSFLSNKFLSATAFNLQKPSLRSADGG